MGPCLFLLEHLFCLSHCKTRCIMSVDNVDLEICPLETSNSTITVTFFLGVNRKGHTTTSTTNYKFYRVLERLHGPWCKHPFIHCHDGFNSCQSTLAKLTLKIL